MGWRLWQRMSVMFSTSDYFHFNWNTPSACSQADQEKEKVDLWFENFNGKLFLLLLLFVEMRWWAQKCLRREFKVSDRDLSFFAKVLVSVRDQEGKNFYPVALCCISAITELQLF